MKNKPIIYIKQPEGPRIPITVRLEWLPNGVIKPCMYWTPDGSCYEIRHIYEMTRMAFIKDKGEGIRFRVISKVTETPEPYSDHLHTWHETYLYLADNMFCGRNFIDGRYGHKGKEFITVVLDVFPDCEYRLVSFEVKGQRYTVEKTLAIEPRGSFHAGGVGIWHKVEARRIISGTPRVAALYFEVNKWFLRRE